MSKQSKKAVSILWLHNMKAKGRTRCADLAEQYQRGEIPIHTLNQARQFQASISLLLQIVTDCPMELEELHEMVKTIKPRRQQGNIFRTPKNPM